MKTFKPVSGLSIEKPLQKHHLYACATSLLVERFPDLIQQGKVTHLLSFGTTLYTVKRWHFVFGNNFAKY